MTDLELAFTPALDLARMIATRAVSPVGVVSNTLARIDDVNPKVNCFCFVWHDEAVKAAHLAAQAVARGETLGTLHGVPIALKDTTPTAGHRTTLGSYTHEHWIPDRDAYIVGALRRVPSRSTGTVPIGLMRHLPPAGRSAPPHGRGPRRRRPGRYDELSSSRSSCRASCRALPLPPERR